MIEESGLRRPLTIDQRDDRAPFADLRRQGRRSHTLRADPVDRPILVANGNASGIDLAAVSRVERALARYCHSVEVRITYTVEELDELARQATGEKRRLVIFGGDGSVHEAANLSCTLAGECGLPDLGLIPAGRANNIAHALGIPLDLADAAHAAMELHPSRIDLVEVSAGAATTHVVEGLSVGIHSRLRARYAACNSADLLEAARVLRGAPRDICDAEISLRLDGRVQEELQGAQLFIANLPLYGPGLRVVPSARPDDGALDVVLLRLPRPRIRLIPGLVRLRRGTHIGQRGTRTWRSGTIELTAHNAPVIADTKVLDSGPVRIRALPRRLPIVAPRPS